MKRGADRTIINLSSQPPNQTAILCGHHKLSKEIENFDESTIGTKALCRKTIINILKKLFLVKQPLVQKLRGPPLHRERVQHFHILPKQEV
jgi:hypothetical protein